MISVVIPCHNEEKNVSILLGKLETIFKNYSRYEIIFIDDGSDDKTLQEIQKLSLRNKKVKCISFTKNFGHQNALKAGFDFASGQAVITMDADLQHPPSIILKMIDKWKKNKTKVVHAIKINNNTNVIRDIFTKLGYFIINKLSSNIIEPGGSDFCLYDKEVVNCIKNFSGTNLMFRSFVKWLGFKKDLIHYTPNKRIYGKSSYTISQLVEIVRLSIVRFSVKPLRLILLIGLITMLLTTIFIIVELLRLFFYSAWPTGLLTLLILQLFFGGITLFAIGVIGEYLGFLIKESSNSPNYIISKKINL